MGEAQGKKVPRRCCAETSKRGFRAGLRPDQPITEDACERSRHSRETGDSGDPAGTGRKTRQATTGDVHPSCEQAGLRPSSPTCEPRVRQCTRSDTGRAAGSAHAAAALDREEGQRVRPGWLISASPNRRILTRTQQGGRPGSCPCKSQAGETSTNWQGTKDILATMLDRPRSRGHEHNAYAAAREGHRQCGACILSIVHEGRYQRNPG